MTEKTLQALIIMVGIVTSIVMLGITGTFIFLVIRDGNSDIVNTAFNDLVGIGQGLTYLFGTVIVGKPIATGFMSFMTSKGQAAQTTAVNTTTTITPPNIPSAI